jgi:hypothetical protein
MIARKVRLFSLDHFSLAAAGIQSWMLVMGTTSDANRIGIAKQFAKGTQRG